MPKTTPEMQPMSAAESCPKCHSPKWLLIIMGALIVGLTIIVIVLALRPESAEPEEISILDENKEVDIEEESVKAGATQSMTFLETVEFEYPVGWHAARHYEDLYTYIDLSPVPIRYLNAYGSGPSLVSVKFSTLSPAFETQALGEVDYVKQGNYTVYHTEELLDMLSTPSEPVTDETYTYIYSGEGQGASFSISFTDYLTETTEDNEGWETIINSLKFEEM